MKKLMGSTAAKIIGYILLVIAGIISVTSGLGIYSAIVLRFYWMDYYRSAFDLPPVTESDIFYENLRIMLYNFRYELIVTCILAAVLLICCFVFLICVAGHKKEKDELMERFVRGDKSRHTEGSGLGLSIAKSLTQLQGGEFELTVDGDFFKVVLSFPVV